MAGRRGDQNPDLLTVDQVAGYLQLNRMTVYKYIREGRIPASRIGKSYRIRRQDLEAFLEACRVEGRPQEPLGRPPSARKAVPRATVSPQPVDPGTPVSAMPPGDPGPDRPTPEEITGHPLERVLRSLH